MPGEECITGTASDLCKTFNLRGPDLKTIVENEIKHAPSEADTVKDYVAADTDFNHFVSEGDSQTLVVQGNVGNSDALRYFSTHLYYKALGEEGRVKEGLNALLHYCAGDARGESAVGHLLLKSFIRQLAMQLAEATPDAIIGFSLPKGHTDKITSDNLDALLDLFDAIINLLGSKELVSKDRNACSCICILHEPHFAAAGSEAAEVQRAADFQKVVNHIRQYTEREVLGKNGCPLKLVLVNPAFGKGFPCPEEACIVDGDAVKNFGRCSAVEDTNV